MGITKDKKYEKELHRGILLLNYALRILRIKSEFTFFVSDGGKKLVPPTGYIFNIDDYNDVVLEKE